MAKYANRQSGQCETLVMFVGSTPTLATWARRPKVGRQFRNLEIRVRVSVSPLEDMGRQPDRSGRSGLLSRDAARRKMVEFFSVTRAHGPKVRHQFGRLEIRVRVSVGPLEDVGRQPDMDCRSGLLNRDPERG